MSKYPRLFVLLLACLSLTSCSPELTLDSPDGKTVCNIYTRADSSVRRISLSYNGGKASSFNIESSVCDGGAGIEFIDLDFDSVADIRVAISDGEHTRYSSFLCDPATSSFHVNEKLDSLVSPIPDIESKRISAPYFTHTVEPATDDSPEVYIDEYGLGFYEWRSGRLCEVRRESTSYFSESEIYRVALYEADSDGVLRATSERWLTPEKYRSEGYADFGWYR